MSAATSAISVENLGKQYVIAHGTGDDGLRHALESAVRAPFQRSGSRRESRRTRKEEFWALSEVSFSVERGEAVGIIGRNGAGKSTLLKLLSRITEPTTGMIRYRGRVASLLEVGTGFHPELTGRENIFLNAAILGMRRSEITRKFDEIVAFSEVEKFLDTPVKRYSSGMYVRLAFAVAAHLEPDIMLIDEVLAVGDATFQQKCLGKMGSVVNEGRTVLFVSHNMAAISSLCTRALLIDGGRLMRSGPPDALIEEYLSGSRMHAKLELETREDRKGSGRLRFTRVEIRNDRAEVVERVISGQDISICLDYKTRERETLRNAVVQVKFFGVLGQPLFACLSRVSLADVLALPPDGRLVCRIPRLPLVPGIYTYTIWCEVGGNMEDFVAHAGTLSVAEGDFFGTGKLPPGTVGDFLVDHEWSVT